MTQPSLRVVPGLPPDTDEPEDVLRLFIDMPIHEILGSREAESGEFARLPSDVYQIFADRMAELKGECRDALASGQYAALEPYIIGVDAFLGETAEEADADDTIEAVIAHEVLSAMAYVSSVLSSPRSS